MEKSEAENTSLILASGSMARRQMMEDAGLHFSSIPADIDESAIIDRLHEQKVSLSDIALDLSKEKALAVALQNPTSLVIGSDQILEFEGQILTKASSAEEARSKLNMLKGKTHKLISAVSIAQGGNVLWHNISEATLTMRDFDDAFLEDYLACAGEALTRSVGAYQLENHGSWLFSSIQGDYFTILGMPLLPLLGYLQDHQGVRL